ncbi:hypothetical protein CARUB_v10010831mg [Capsella rubella]|uniref:Pectinesterase inhibitor domain-containing protein n=1 Tax=Capsella rubella TaxID=81985 RepID=R0IJP5_9BRAS|nr:pectinesterase inhibitor [Capsella rubella]EOA38720.1 hypothetical protein CARUB_v10010831mg [Capsella rubella]
MVVFIKNNFLLVLILILHSFVVSSYARFSTKVTESEISNICSHKGTNASFCVEFLRSSTEVATLDHSSLTNFLINYNFQKTSVMLTQFQSLINSTSDRSSKGSYEACSEIFDLAIGRFDSALKYLSTKDYNNDFLMNDVSSTITMAKDCGWELSSVVKLNPQVSKAVSIVENVSSIVLVLLECFLRTDKTLCY